MEHYPKDKKANETISSEGVIKVGGLPLKYKRSGNGEPLLVIGSADYYSKAFSKNLENSFELIFVDLGHFVPDFHLTEEELNKVSLKTFSDEVEAIRDHLGLDEVGVIGHSVHGLIALDYAVRYPSRVSKLIIIGGVPYNMTEFADLKDEHWEKNASEDRKTILAVNMETAQRVLETIPPDQQFAVAYHYQAPLYWADPRYDASRLLTVLRTCPQLMDKLFASVPTRETVIKQLKALTVPTLVIHGKLDFALPHKAWEDIIKNNADIRYVLMEEAGHNPQTEESSVEAFDRHLLGWIAEMTHTGIQ